MTEFEVHTHTKRANRKDKSEKTLPRTHRKVFVRYVLYENVSNDVGFVFVFLSGKSCKMFKRNETYLAKVTRETVV